MYLLSHPPFFFWLFFPLTELQSQPKFLAVVFPARPRAGNEARSSGRQGQEFDEGDRDPRPGSRGGRGGAEALENTQPFHFALDQEFSSPVL